jgi:HEAT repeat protein
MITSVDQALTILENKNLTAVEREMAGRYLRAHPDNKAIVQLVRALQDDDRGVAWSAAESLSRLGEPAVKELCHALSDHIRVGDPRLLSGAYHVLYHLQDEALAGHIVPLLHALKGPVPDLKAMEEADRLLRRLDHQKRLR